MSCGNNCSCNQDDSRRDFLRKGMIGGLDAVLLTGCSANEKSNPATGEKVNVLTHDAKLVSVNKSQVADFKPHISEEDVRKGIPDKKFVMVINLAKCDGCGKCTKACNKMHYLPSNKEWIPILDMQDTPETAPYYFPKPSIIAIIRHVPKFARLMPLLKEKMVLLLLILTGAAIAGFVWLLVHTLFAFSSGRNL